ncbi:asparaginase [bacterium]|nr:asparaginase [bacterium]
MVGDAGVLSGTLVGDVVGGIVGAGAGGAGGWHSGSSDAGMNLLCAAHVATGSIAEVGVCMHATMNDDACLFIRGTKVRKMHTIRRDAFRPINDLPLARVYPSGKIEQISPVARKRTSGETKLDARFESKIALLKTHPSADPGVMDYYLGKGYKGFVIEGTGVGHFGDLGYRGSGGTAEPLVPFG